MGNIETYRRPAQINVANTKSLMCNTYVIEINSPVAGARGAGSGHDGCEEEIEQPSEMDAISNGADRDNSFLFEDNSFLFMVESERPRGRLGAVAHADPSTGCPPRRNPLTETLSLKNNITRKCPS